MTKATSRISIAALGLFQIFWYSLPLVPIGDPDGWGSLLFVTLSALILVIMLVFRVLKVYRTGGLIQLAEPIIFGVGLVLLSTLTSFAGWHTNYFRGLMIFLIGLNALRLVHEFRTKENRE